MIHKSYWRLVWLVIACSLCCFVAAMAQEKVNVVTKHVEQKLDYATRDKLVIMAEKSKISISSWDKDYIFLELDLISKHARLDVAKEELQYLQYKIEKRNDGYLIKNIFVPRDNFTTIKGNLSTLYKIKVPKRCAVSIVNLYGEIEMTSIQAAVDIHAKFVDLTARHIDGPIKLESFFSNIRMEDSKGDLKATLEKSDMDLLGYDGSLDINSNYGEIGIVQGQYTSFMIKAARTAISYSTSHLDSYNYQLKTYSSDIYIPEELGEISNGNKKVNFSKNNGDQNVWIYIETTYSPITINQTYNVTSK